MLLPYVGSIRASTDVVVVVALLHFCSRVTLDASVECMCIKIEKCVCVCVYCVYAFFGLFRIANGLRAA